MLRYIWKHFVETSLNLWQQISHLGIDDALSLSRQEKKRLIFFNQLLFIGAWATLSQIPFVWPFIGKQALIFIGVFAFLLLLLSLNQKKWFGLSKWLYFLGIYSSGVVTTLLLGGAALYHIQSLLIFASCLILFDLKKEWLPILLGLPFVSACIAIGELSLLGAPDFSEHPWTGIARFANISSLILVNFILTVFIIKLNKRNENELAEKSEELRVAKDELESIVEKRTEQLREQNKLLELQNEEKILLLREVHHRVRNNLQIITSLINLQSSGLEDKKSIEAIKEIRGRVESMALVHRKMYETANFKNISLIDYVKSIRESLSSLYGVEHCNMKLEIPESTQLNLEQMIPVGLIINELLSNFYKHVIPYRNSESAIQISAELLDDNRLNLVYSDNGPGISPEKLEQGKTSLGLQLIHNLVDQLEGKLEMKNNNGATFQISLLKK